MNRGFSGYTSRHLRSLLPRILSRDLVDGAVAATLFIGANDANDKDMNPQQYVPVEEYAPSEGHKWKAFVENRDGTKMERPAKTNEINKR